MLLLQIARLLTAIALVFRATGAPLDYHLIFGAGAYTVVYILARALGKYGGAYLWAAATVRKFPGFTLPPHSGVSLALTGIAVSVLSGSAPECASILQGTIAPAADSFGTGAGPGHPPVSVTGYKKSGMACAMPLFCFSQSRRRPPNRRISRRRFARLTISAAT